MKTRTLIVGGLVLQARGIVTPWPLTFRRTWLWIGCLAFATIAFGPHPAPAAIPEAWVQRYGSESGSQDFASRVVTDVAGNVIVVGSTTHYQAGTASDTLVIKYSSAGVPLWTNRYDGTGWMVSVDSSGNVVLRTNRFNGPDSFYRQASAVAVDGSGKVFVTGYSVGSGSGHDYATIAYSDAGLPLWTNWYNGPDNGFDEANAVAVDGSGRVFVTGYSYSSRAGYDYATIAYSGAGVPLWTNRYNGPGNREDRPTAVAVDGSGNVFVTGASGYWNGFDWSSDFATIAYSGSGVPLWTNRYNGPGNGPDQPVALAVDASGNVFVTGNYYPYGSGGSADSATIAYSSAGVVLWINRHNGSATALAMDSSGKMFVTGSYATIAYSASGPLWTNQYAGQGRALAVDGSGKVIVTGHSVGSGGDFDYATIAYSIAGVPLWTNRYGGRGAASDIANAMAVDGRGNVFVTGYSYGIPEDYATTDYTTIAYSGTSVPLWTNRYNGTGNGGDQAIALAVNASGNVFVTGNSTGSGGDTDYLTIAYSGAGVPLWTNRFNGSGNGHDVARAVAVDGSGNVFVTGSSGDFCSLGCGGGDIATIAYSGAGLPLWTNFYHGSARALAVDGNGNVFVAGWSGYGCTDLGCGGGHYATIAYSGAGVPLWTNHYAGPTDGGSEPTAMVVDVRGNVFVTGASYDSGSASDYATIAYSGAGVPLWTNRYNGPDNGSDQTTAVAVDASGNVFVTGSSYATESYYDYATIAYSGAGLPLWTNRYQGPGGISDQPTAVAVDGRGNVFVTGWSGYCDYGCVDYYTTIAYSGAGVPLWTNRYHSPGYGGELSQSKASLAIGSDNALYVTTSAGRFLPDFVTVKYVWQTEIAIQLLSTIPPNLNLTVWAAPNSYWAIEQAPQLTGPWSNATTLLIGTNGFARFQDTNSHNPAGFYRAVQQ